MNPLQPEPSKCCPKCDAKGKRGSATYIECMHPSCECHRYTSPVVEVENSPQKKALDHAMNQVLDNQERSSRLPYTPHNETPSWRSRFYELLQVFNIENRQPSKYEVRINSAVEDFIETELSEAEQRGHDRGLDGYAQAVEEAKQEGYERALGDVRETIEGMKVPEGDIMELTGSKMNENSIRHLVHDSCNMRQNVVLDSLLTELQKNTLATELRK